MRRPTEPTAGVALALTGILILVGVVLRIDQLPWHSNVWGIDWLGYFEPQARHLRHGNVFAWALSWEGLHPPLSGAIHGLLQAVSASFTIHWAFTIAAGLGAAVVLGGIGWRTTESPAALVLTVGFVSIAPMQANYGLNTSPYPWALLLAAISTATLLHALQTDTPQAWTRSAVASALAAQVHILVTAAVLGQILFLLLKGPGWLRERKGVAKRWATVVGVSLLLIVGMSLFKTTDSWTFHISEEQPWPGTVKHMLTGRFVAMGAAWGPAAWIALGVVAGLLQPRSRTAISLLLLQTFGYLAALALFYEIHVADPRLTHYFLVPQMLLIAAGAWGLAAGAQRLGRVGPAVAVVVAVGASGVWLGATGDWYEAKAQRAQQRIETSAAGDVRPLWADAEDGDVVLYLWDHSFLNDEPEHLDPIGAVWPTWRTGRPCYDDPDPRVLCNRHRGAHFYFSPNLLSREEFASFEETLRLILNMAHEPGRAVVVAAPNPGETAERPWPWEQWLRFHGAEVVGPLAGGVMTYTLPVGTQIPEPPPIHPDE